MAFLPEIEKTLLEPEVICKSNIKPVSSTIVHIIIPIIKGISNFEENKSNFSNLPPFFILMTVLWLIHIIIII